MGKPKSRCMEFIDESYFSFQFLTWGIILSIVGVLVVIIGVVLKIVIPGIRRQSYVDSNILSSSEQSPSSQAWGESIIRSTYNLFQINATEDPFTCKQTDSITFSSGSTDTKLFAYSSDETTVQYQFTRNFSLVNDGGLSPSTSIVGYNPLYQKLTSQNGQNDIDFFSDLLVQEDYIKMVNSYFKPSNAEERSSSFAREHFAYEVSQNAAESMGSFMEEGLNTLYDELSKAVQKYSQTSLIRYAMISLSSTALVANFAPDAAASIRGLSNVLSFNIMRTKCPVSLSNNGGQKYISNLIAGNYEATVDSSDDANCLTMVQPLLSPVNKLVDLVKVQHPGSSLDQSSVVAFLFTQTTEKLEKFYGLGSSTVGFCLDSSDTSAFADYPVNGASETTIRQVYTGFCTLLGELRDVLITINEADINSEMGSVNNLGDYKFCVDRNSLNPEANSNLLFIYEILNHDLIVQGIDIGADLPSDFTLDIPHGEFSTDVCKELYGTAGKFLRNGANHITYLSTEGAANFTINSNDFTSPSEFTTSYQSALNEFVDNNHNVFQFIALKMLVTSQLSTSSFIKNPASGSAILSFADNEKYKGLNHLFFPFAAVDDASRQFSFYSIMYKVPLVLNLPYINQNMAEFNGALDLQISGIYRLLAGDTVQAQNVEKLAAFSSGVVHSAKDYVLQDFIDLRTYLSELIASFYDATVAKDQFISRTLLNGNTLTETFFGYNLIKNIPIFELDPNDSALVNSGLAIWNLGFNSQTYKSYLVKNVYFGTIPDDSLPVGRNNPVGWILYNQASKLATDIKDITGASVPMKAPIELVPTDNIVINTGKSDISKAFKIVSINGDTQFAGKAEFSHLPQNYAKSGATVDVYDSLTKTLVPVSFSSSPRKYEGIYDVLRGVAQYGLESCLYPLRDSELTEFVIPCSCSQDVLNTMFGQSCPLSLPEVKESFINVDPATGFVIDYTRCYISASKVTAKSGELADLPVGSLVPRAIVVRSSVAPAAATSEYADTFENFLVAGDSAFIALVVIGGLLLIAGIVFLVLYIIKKRREHVTASEMDLVEDPFKENIKNNVTIL